MICGVIGDFIGSVFENSSIRAKNLTQLIYDKSCITDESVMIAATCEALMDDSLDFSEVYLKWFNRYPNVAWGFGMSNWGAENDTSYTSNSTGNLSASRAIPIGFLDLNLASVNSLAIDSACCSHNSEEGIDGARAIVYTIWAIRNGKSQQEIYSYLFAEFGYLLDFYTDEQLRQSNEIDSSAINTVPVAIWIAFNSDSFNDIIHRVIYLMGHGDTDSICTMACGIGYAYHGEVDEALKFETQKWLFKNAQDVLQFVQVFERQKELCKLPF